MFTLTITEIDLATRAITHHRNEAQVLKDLVNDPSVAEPVRALRKAQNYLGTAERHEATAALLERILESQEPKAVYDCASHELVIVETAKLAA